MELTRNNQAKYLKYFSIVVITSLLITLLSYFFSIYTLSLVFFLIISISSVAGLVIVKNLKSKNNIPLAATQVKDLKTASILFWIALSIISLILIALIALIVLIGTYGFGR